MGVELDGPGNIFCDNESVLKSDVNPKATLKEKLCQSLIINVESVLLREFQIFTLFTPKRI